MSKYRNTVLTALGIDLARRANAGQAKFKVTKVATSADDLGDISTEQLERMTEVPNVAQYGTITDAEPLETDNSAIGVSLRFTNKGLTAGYKIRIVGLYVREDGQQNDILYAVTTATEPEYMPDFNDQVLYRFNMQMYVVVGRAQSVSVLVDDSTVVSVKNFTDYKTTNDERVDKNISDIAQLRQDFEANKETVKEDIKKAGEVKSVTMNSAKHTPDASGDVNLGDALLPGITTVTVGSDDVDIVYKSGKNRYTADITNALNNVINSAINNGHLTETQKKEALESATIEFIDAEQNQTHSDPTYYSASHQQATYDAGSNKFSFNNSGTMWALNDMHQEMTQKISDISEELSTYNRKVTKNQNDIQALDTNAVKSVNNVTPVSGNVTLDTVDTLKVVTDLGDNKSLLSVLMDAYDDSIFQIITNAETIESKKSSDATLVTQELLDGLTKIITSKISDLSKNISGKGTDIADIKNNYATKQWVTDNFMPKPYITNSSSTADTYSKAHPDQLVILTK